MSFFRYEAVDRTGKIVVGTMDAPSEAHVSIRLTQMGYRPSQIVASQGGSVAVTNVRTGRTATPTAKVTAPPTKPSSKLAGVTAREYAVFYRQMASLVRAGINLYTALDSLAMRTNQPTLKQTVREMSDEARNGGQVSTVMERYPRVYPAHVAAAVRAGETGGFIDVVLDELAFDYEQEVAFYKGMWLQKTLIIQACLVIAVAQPLFPTLFPNNNLSGYLTLVFLRNIPITAVVLLLLRLYVMRLQLPENRLKRDRMILRFPVFGDLARQRSLASFIRMLRRLYSAGLSPNTSWEGAMNVPANAVVREKLVQSHELMQHNMPLPDAFAQTGLFANEAEQLLATGMMSGQMVEMLDRVAEYYQENVDRAFTNSQYWMKRIVGVFVIGMGGLAVIIMARTYFSSIFAFADSFQE